MIKDIRTKINNLSQIPVVLGLLIDGYNHIAKVLNGSTDADILSEKALFKS